jgi:phosphoribosyl 1,2-cyclic phosphodiesterase
MNPDPDILVKFWGVRGSIPCPGPTTVKYGGNTPSIEVRFPKEGNRLIIIDAGSGIRELGLNLMATQLPKGPIQADIFLSHTHWDHIQGFPFFTPIFVPSTTLKVWGARTHDSEGLDQTMGDQMSYRYFPIRGVELAARIEYLHLQEGQVDLGDGIILHTHYLNHPVLCLGYRFEYRGKVFCTSFDTEPYRNLFCTDPNDPDYDAGIVREAELAVREQNEAADRFISGADLVVYDAQYTQTEYEAGKIGWGHTPMEYACRAGVRNQVKSLALFHHDPLRTDQQLDELALKHGEPGAYGPTEIFFAKEGLSVAI